MSEWTDFVKKYARTNNLSYKEALKKAGPEYRKKKGTKGADNISRDRKDRMTKDFTTKKGDKLKTGKRKGKAAYAMDKS
jgi:hypothetical protein